MEILYNSIINFKTLDNSSWSENLSMIFTYYSLLIAFIIIPKINIFLLTFKKEKDLQEEKLK
jgi:hypothetical protein